jgi:hypothetical protein
VTIQLKYMQSVVLTLLSSCVAMSITTIAKADPVSVVGRVSTQGVGAELGYKLSEQLSIRANLNGATINRDVVSGDVSYQTKLKLQTAGILADYYPIKDSGFRLTAGLYQNGNQFTLSNAALTKAVKIGNTTYEPNQIGTINGDLDYKAFSPYIGMGWGTRLKTPNGLVLSADLGVLHQTPTTLKLTVACASAITNTPVCDQLKTDADIERQKVQNDLNKFKLYPVLSLGVGYQF